MREVFDEFLQYDPLPRIAVPTESLKPSERWLRLNPHAWRADRQLTRAEGHASERQAVSLIVGEEGSGKTTQLNAIIEKGHVSPSQITIWLDFSDAASVLLAPANDSTKQILSYVESRVEIAIYGRALDGAFEAAKIRTVLSRRAHYSLSKVKREHREPEKLSDGFLLGSQSIRTAYDAYMTQLSIVDQGLLSLEACQSMEGHRIVFVVDNIDHLGEDKIRVLFATLSGAITDLSEAFIALWVEHEDLAGIFRHQRPVHTYRLQGDGAIFDIISTRVAGAQEYIGYSVGKVREARDLAERLQNAISSIQTDPISARLLEDWQNGNIRQMTQFVAAIADQTLSYVPDRRSFRGLVYATLVQRNSNSSLLDVFSPENIITSKYPGMPFIFLKMRILSYLQQAPAAEGALLASLYDDFHDHFGIGRIAMDKELGILAKKNENSGALVRRTKPLTPLTDEPGVRIMLLPAGRLFIETIIFSCDFLSWVYEGTPNMPDAGDFSTRREIKLARALIIVEHLLIPEFLREHPYLKHNTNITNLQRKRFSSYRSCFNYGPNRWFVQRLIEEINIYARDRDIRTERLRRVNGKVEDIIGRLNGIAQSDESNETSL
jgi:hypothetical protein